MSTETITSTSTITESLPSSSSSSSPSTSTDATAIDFTIQQHVRRTTGTLGSDIAPFYEPRKLVTQPLTPKDVTLELLLASQTHMGHATSLWNPANQRYIYGIRNGIHIISLEATAAHLRRAAKVVEGVARSGGLILFIGTRPGQVRAVVKAAKMSKGCHLFERWIPGTITNGDQILGTGGVKVVDQKDEKVELPGLAERVAEQRALRPDLVVCLNPLENYIALRECGIEGIPTIGIIDTDADPTWVTYPIPANDDS
jgi:small subunit ribosomal protein S2